MWASVLAIFALYQLLNEVERGFVRRLFSFKNFKEQIYFEDFLILPILTTTHVSVPNFFVRLPVFYPKHLSILFRVGGVNFLPVVPCSGYSGLQMFDVMAAEMTVSGCSL